MKTRRRSRLPAGVSLLEAVIAVGVMAVAVPLALSAIGSAGIVGVSARAETRAPGIADWCRIELEAARRGESLVLPPITAQQAFPGGDEVLALAFDREGALLGSVESDDFEAGIDRLGSEQVFFLAALSGRPDDSGVVVTVNIEYPAARPAERRDAVAFHTILP